jgi:hypothetical protein
MSFKSFFEDETLYSHMEHRWKKNYVTEVVESMRLGLSGLTEYIQNIQTTNKLTEKEVLDILCFMIHTLIICRSREEVNTISEVNKKLSNLVYCLCKPFPFHTTRVSMHTVKVQALKYRRIQEFMEIAYSFQQYDIMFNFLKFGYDPSYELYKKMLWNKDSKNMEIVLTYSPLTTEHCHRLWKEINEETDEYRETYTDEVSLMRTISILNFSRGYLM